jgi:hypothetical protein
MDEKTLEVTMGMAYALRKIGLVLAPRWNTLTSWPRTYRRTV